MVFVSGVLAVISLGGVPDDLPVWATWLEALDGNLGRWLVLIAAVGLILAANSQPAIRFLNE